MKILTRPFKTYLARRTIDTLSDEISKFYVFAGKAQTEQNWDETINSISGLRFDTDKEIIFGYKITEPDISLMIKNIEWAIGNTYDMYDDQTVGLENENFYVSTTETDGTKSIFKCLKNNKTWSAGTFIINPVFDKPSKTRTSLTEPFFTTSDGYDWKYLYNISIEDVDKFETSNLIPISSQLNISNTAVYGSLDVITVDYCGSGYVNYAYANVKESEISGNRRLYSIFPDTIKTIYIFDVITANTNYVENTYVDVFDGANTLIVSGEVYFSSNTQVQISLDNESIELEPLLPVRLVQNLIDQEFSTTRRISLPNISYTSGDYNNTALYVKAGTGAGQLKTIEKYTVTNNNFFIEVDDPFTPPLDNTSRVQILPRIEITGNGVGAKAIVEISSEFNLIENVVVISRGYGYTQASAKIVNTVGDPALIRPIISPLGGHGYDIAKELNVGAICISTRFNSSLPQINGFNKIGLIGGATFANSTINANNSFFDDRTSLSITNTYNGINDTGFIVGERIFQGTEISGLIHEVSANTIFITDITGSNFIANTNLVATGEESTARCLINNITYPNRIKNLCETFYVEDLEQQIDRVSEQQEVVKILIEF